MIWHFDSEFGAPRFWIDSDEAEEKLGESTWESSCYRVVYRDIAAATNERTLISTVIPRTFHGNKLPSVVPYQEDQDFRGPNELETLFLTSIFSSFVLDYVIRQKVMETLNFFFLYSLPVPRLSSSSQGKDEIIFEQIIARAARLVCSSEQYADLWGTTFSEKWKSETFWYPDFTRLSYGPLHEQTARDEIIGSSIDLTKEWDKKLVFQKRLSDRRDTGKRAQLRAEIDALVAYLFELTRDEFGYILGTFPVLKEKEERVFGEYQSKRKCLEEFDRIGMYLT